MTYTWDVNDPSSFTGASALFKHKALLKAAGWTVTASGDGLSAFSSSSDIITQSGSGANGLNNTSAWYVLQSPAGAGTRQLEFQRGSSSRIWTLKYSYSVGFSGGSPSSTVAGTATDAQTMWSAATVFGTDATYHVHCMADNAAPYGNYLLCLQTGGLSGSFGGTYTNVGVFVMDPLISSTYPGADVDPMMFYAPTTTEGAFQASVNTKTFGYLKKGLAGEGFVNIPWLLIGSDSAALMHPNAAGSLVQTGKDMPFPVLYARDTSFVAPLGHKGYSSLLQVSNTYRMTPALESVSTTNDTIYFGDFMLPWNGAGILI